VSLVWRYVGDSWWELVRDVWGTASGTGFNMFWGEHVGLFWG
jgi:hypothetical protein